MRIISERSKITTVGPGVESIDVEIVVEEAKNGFDNYYINLHACDGVIYSITKNGIYDYIVGIKDDNGEEPEFLEEYESLEQAKASKFYKFFEIAERMLDELNSFDW